MNSATSLTVWQQFLLVLFRFCVGWHLFYQGWGKMHAVRWTAEPYLRSATGPLATLFHKMAENKAWLSLADYSTMCGLMILGLLLMIGLFTRTASVASMGLLFLFYAAQPPLPVHGFAVRTPDGNELYVNKVLIEILALLMGVLFNTGKISGLDLLVHEWIRKKKSGARLQDRGDRIEIMEQQL